jgi:hypothetical protein
MSGKQVRIAVLTAVTGIALLGGGLFLGGTLVSAQEPTPEATEEAAPSTPDPTEEAAPSTPQDEEPSEDTERSRAECDHDGDGQPDAEGDKTGVRFRAGGQRTLAQ